MSHMPTVPDKPPFPESQFCPKLAPRFDFGSLRRGNRMRLFFGIVLGIAITLGAFFVHDNNVPPDPILPPGAERQIVNWEVLRDVVSEQTAYVRELWDRAFGK